MENNNGRGIFYGVMGVATLVVAIVGATFAYFAASTNSDEGDVAANSATVKGTLEFNQVAQYIAPDLIPASNATMLASFAQTGNADTNTGKCRGASAANHNGNYGMCSYYTFTITNKSSVASQVYLSLKSDSNGFDSSLEYCVYEGDTTATVTKACASAPVDSATEQFTSVNLAAKSGTKTYTVIMYYKNVNTDQTDSGAGKTYTGTILASTSDGTNQIVGYIAGADNGNSSNSTGGE